MENESTEKESIRIDLKLLEKEEKKEQGNLWSNAEFMKWFIGTVVLGITSTIVTTLINRSELRIKQFEADSQLISAISSQFDKADGSGVTTLRYYKHVLPFITSESIRDQVIAELKKLDSLTNSLVQIQDTQESKGQALTDSAGIPAETVISLNQVDSSAGPTNTSAKEIETKEEKQVAKVFLTNKSKETEVRNLADSLNKLSIQSMNQISEVKKELEPVLAPNPKKVDARYDWFKTGYYLEFNGSLRVLLDEISATDPKGIKISLADISKDSAAKYTSTVRVDLGKSVQITLGDFQYEIELNLIGHAGKNPFTKAAYITVTTYKK